MSGGVANIRGDKVMRIGAYQFAVTNEINRNFSIMKQAIEEAIQKGIKLLIFPECALTGYPPRDIENSSVVEFDKLHMVYEQIQKLVDCNNIYVIAGTIIKEDEKFYNSAIFFSPHKEKLFYHKRALWGWDKDNFSIGNMDGIFEIENLKIGVRICFEVRFPEFFRELYREHTDLNIILFYDVSDYDDEQRYSIIESHIRTRAVENVTYTLTVDAIHPYQTAPTALYDRSGVRVVELKRNKPGLLVYDLDNKERDFGEWGRKEISDWLITNVDLWYRIK